ncbi:MAG: beta-lactamase family protein [Proteobacteria bacterium]|nr:beta-lactamase family protein [Pseudomonadota bacterium]
MRRTPTVIFMQSTSRSAGPFLAFLLVICSGCGGVKPQPNQKAEKPAVVTKKEQKEEQKREPVVFPMSPAGRRAEKLAEFLIKADERAEAAFVVTHFTGDDAPEGVLASIWKQCPELVLRHVTASTDFKAKLYLQSSVNQSWVRISLVVEQEPSHKIDAFVFRPADGLPTNEASSDKEKENAYEVFNDTRKLPGGIVGKRIEEIVAVINANAPERVRTFAQDSFTEKFRNAVPMERIIEFMSELYKESGGLEFYSERKYEGKVHSGKTHIILRSPITERWSRAVLELEPSSPHRIAGLSFESARPPHDAVPQKNLSQKEIVSRVKRYVTKLAKAEMFSGAVLLAKDGKVLFKAAHGQASKRFNVPNKIDTKFNLGSLNKMFTSVSIAQLVQNGKLSFDDTIDKYISEQWLPKEITAKIRIKHLLTHTSGLGDYLPRLKSLKTRLRNLDDYKTLFASEKLAFEPGERFQYSNSGMLLLGVVIEKLTGQSYFDYVSKNVYEPAQMKNTPSTKGGPAGGGFSTAPDLLNFDKALRKHTLLSEEYTNIVLSEKPDLKSPNYGYGFLVTHVAGDLIVGHSGGTDGVRAYLDMFLDSGYTAIVLSNYDFGADFIAGKIRELVAARSASL